MRLPLRWKLALAVGLPMLAFGGVTTWFGHQRLRAEAFEATEAMAAERAASIAGRYDVELASVAQVAKSAASFISAHPDLTDSEIYEIASRNVMQHALIYGSCIAFEPEPARARFAPYAYRARALTSATGAQALARMDVADVYDYTSDRWDWYTIPRQIGEGVWTEPFFDEGAGNIVMCTYAAPFFRRDGSFRGVATVDVPLDELQTALDRGRKSFSRIGRTEAFIILSRRGMIISSEDKKAVGQLNAFDWARGINRPDLLELGKKMISGQTGTARLPAWGPNPVTGRPDGNTQFLYYAPIPSTGWSFVGGLDEPEIMAPVYARLRDRALAFGALTAIAVGVSVFLANRVSRPIARLSAAVRELGSGNLEARAATIDTGDEIGDLSRAFNSMVGELRAHIDALTEESAKREAVESELRVARVIQESLLPRVFPPFPHRDEFDLHAVVAPARYVAGDFFDFFFLDDHRLALIMADVSGKGAPAAVYMAVTRTILRDLLRDAPEAGPGAVLTEANKRLLEQNTHGMFVTLWLGIYDTRVGEIRYANAGHPHPYRVSGSALSGGTASAVKFGEVTGPILGILDLAEYAERQARLEPGESVVFFTDGVPEARRIPVGLNGDAKGAGAIPPPKGRATDFYGLERFERLLTSIANTAPGGADDLTGAARYCARIVEETDRFQSNERADDVTVMTLRRVR